MWGLFEGISFEAAQAMHAARQREKKRKEQYAAAVLAQQRAYDAARSLPTHRINHTLHPGDCPSCGSQEFRRWQGVSVCAYCRSTAQATQPAIESPRMYDAFVSERASIREKINMRYAAMALRRESHAILTTE